MVLQLQLFLTPDDEAGLSRALAEAFPGVAFVDGDVWDTSTPPVRTTLDQCRQNMVMLWNPQVAPTLPCVPRGDGRFLGPVVGPVVQITRCRLDGGTLRSGRVAASTTGTAQEAFVRQLWRLLERWGTTRARAVNPATGETLNPRVREYLIGPGAARWFDPALGRVLRDRSTENYFDVAT